MSRRFVTYNTEDQAAGLVNVDERGVLQPGGGSAEAASVSWNDLTDKPFGDLELVYIYNSAIDGTVEFVNGVGTFYISGPIDGTGHPHRIEVSEHDGYASFSGVYVEGHYNGEYWLEVPDDDSYFSSVGCTTYDGKWVVTLKDETINGIFDVVFYATDQDTVKEIAVGYLPTAVKPIIFEKDYDGVWQCSHSYDDYVTAVGPVIIKVSTDDCAYYTNLVRTKYVHNEGYAEFTFIAEYGDNGETVKLLYTKDGITEVTE